jgi:hypothetical protein
MTPPWVMPSRERSTLASWQGANNTDEIMAMYIEYKPAGQCPAVPYCPQHVVSVEHIEAIFGIKEGTSEACVGFVWGVG